jgi:translation initiation factor 2 subunit 2
MSLVRTIYIYIPQVYIYTWYIYTVYYIVSGIDTKIHKHAPTPTPIKSLKNSISHHSIHQRKLFERKKKKEEEDKTTFNDNNQIHTTEPMSETTDEKLKDVAADDIEAMFASMKKKSKKSKKKKSKKKKDKKDAAAGDDDDDEVSDSEVKDAETVSEIYSYDEMLDRVFEKLQSNNPELMHKKRYKLKPPQIMRIGTRKCMWHNYPDICETIKRKPDHVMQFYLTELGTTGNLDGNGRLVLKGTFVPKKIESLLRKYITEFVTCHLCKSPDTDLVKDSNSRLFFVQCHACGARRSVSTIKTGYLATQRGERRAARNK